MAYRQCILQNEICGSFILLPASLSGITVLKQAQLSTVEGHREEVTWSVNDFSPQFICISSQFGASKSGELIHWHADLYVQPSLEISVPSGILQSCNLLNLKDLWGSVKSEEGSQLSLWSIWAHWCSSFLPWKLTTVPTLPMYYTT